MSAPSSRPPPPPSPPPSPPPALASAGALASVFAGRAPAAPTTTATPGVLHVLFRVDGGSYVLAAADVLHMESFTSATIVPGAPIYVAGLIQVRGRVVPVVDLRARFGLERQAHTLDSRVVVVQTAGRVVALLADSAREVVRIAPDQFRDAPEMMGTTDQGFVRSIAHVADRLLMLLDLPRVIGEEPHDHGQ